MAKQLTRVSSFDTSTERARHQPIFS